MDRNIVYTDGRALRDVPVKNTGVCVWFLNGCRA